MVPETEPAQQPSGAPSPAELDAGLACLVLIAQFHNLPADAQALRHQLARPQGALQEVELLLGAKALGLKARTVRLRPERLEHTPLPCLALASDGHHFVLARVDAAKALIFDPATKRNEILSREQLAARWDGRAILFASRASLAGDLSRFDFSWFIPAVVKYRKLLLEVFGVSLVLQLFALLTPLFFQVVVDKVLVNDAQSTLEVVGVAYLVSSLFEVALTGLRTYVFSHTTNRIDVELGARLFRHLLALPLRGRGDGRL